MAKLKGGTRNLPTSHKTSVPMAGPNSAPVHSEGGALVRHLKGLEDDPEYFNRTTERMYVFNQDGSLNYTISQHLKRRVRVPGEDMGILKDKIMLHNHPSGFSFSSNDVKFARYVDLAEIRATGKYGTYILRRPANGWPAAGRITSAFRRSRALFTAREDAQVKWTNFAQQINADFVYVPRQGY